MLSISLHDTTENMEILVFMCHLLSSCLFHTMKLCTCFVWLPAYFLLWGTRSAKYSRVAKLHFIEVFCFFCNLTVNVSQKRKCYSLLFFYIFPLVSVPRIQQFQSFHSYLVLCCCTAPLTYHMLHATTL